MQAPFDSGAARLRSGRTGGSRMVAACASARVEYPSLPFALSVACESKRSRSVSRTPYTLRLRRCAPTLRANGQIAGSPVTPSFALAVTHRRRLPLTPPFERAHPTVRAERSCTSKGSRSVSRAPNTLRLRRCAPTLRANGGMSHGRCLRVCSSRIPLTAVRAERSCASKPSRSVSAAPTTLRLRRCAPTLRAIGGALVFDAFDPANRHASACGAQWALNTEESSWIRSTPTCTRCSPPTSMS